MSWLRGVGQSPACGSSKKTRCEASSTSYLCGLVGLCWEDGERIELNGIAQRPECVVPDAIHVLDIYIREAGCQFTIPFCFAEGDAPLLLGREGFFDAFYITFDKSRHVTVFEFLDIVNHGP